MEPPFITVTTTVFTSTLVKLNGSHPFVLLSVVIQIDHKKVVAKHDTLNKRFILNHYMG